jgi:uncharacterized membrane protein YozB (DUF420 family)
VWVLILCTGIFYLYGLRSDSVFLQLKQAAIKTGWYMPAFYCHIIGSSIILIAGLFQFSKKVYNNRPLHKVLGKLYVFGVIFFAAPGAYVMTFFINRGPIVFGSFFIQNTLWILFTFYAWRLIMKGRIDEHIQYMRRSFALAFAAVTLRLYIWLFNTLGISIDFTFNYVLIAFASWVPNLIVAEIINYYSKPFIIQKV